MPGDPNAHAFQCRRCGYSLRDLPDSNRTIICPECGHRNALEDLSRAASAPSWKIAVGLSLLAVYGPFLVMALYALGFVSCSHCKATTCKVLPCAPGLLPVAAARHLFRLPQSLTFTLAFFVSVAMVLALTGLVRRGGW